MSATYVPSQINDIRALQTALRVGGLSVIATNPNPLHGGRNTSVLQRTTRSRHVASSAATGLRLVYANYYTNGYGEFPNSNPVTITASIQKMGTSANDQTPPRVPVTFNGALAGVCDGRGVLTSDPGAFDVAAGEHFFVYTCVTVQSGQGWIFGNYVLGGTNPPGLDDGEGYTDSVDYTLDGSGNITVRQGNGGYSPAAILGAVNGAIQPSVALLGDSLMEGTGDGVYLLSGNLMLNVNNAGFAVRALGGAYGCVKLSQGAEKASQFVGRDKSNLRLRLAQLCTHAIGNYGINDLADPLATIKTNLLTIANMVTARGVKFYQCTLAPKTNSTDGWITVVNQSFANSSQEQNRKDINAWLRDTSASGFVRQCANPSLVGVFDIAAPVEVDSSNTLTLNGGFWRVPPSLTQVNGTGSTTWTTTSVTDTGVSMTTDQYKGYVLRVTSGAGAGQQRTIRGNTGTVLNLSGSSLSPLPAAGDTYQITNVKTVDGTHPSTFGHSDAAAGVNTGMLAV